MEFQNRVNNYTIELDKIYKEVENKKEQSIAKNDIKMVNMWNKNIESLSYELENPQASYICSAIRFINSVVYYPYPNIERNKQLLTTKLNINIEELNKIQSLSLKNDKEEYRQALFELVGIPVKIPTMVETKKIFNEIYESQELTQEEKQEQLFKYEMLTGFERSISYYHGKSGPEKPRLYNEQGMKMSDKFYGSYDILYENGLENGYTL